jgi:hypothetical protein
MGLKRNEKVNFHTGLTFSVLMVAATSALLLFIVPHDTWAMRTVAAAAMGKTFTREKAAARLHGMPLGGVETQIQLYALVHTSPNRERLDACFKKAAAIPAKAKCQKIPLHDQLPDLGVQLFHLALAVGRGCIAGPGACACHPVDGLPLPGRDHPVVHSVLG